MCYPHITRILKEIREEQEGLSDEELRELWKKNIWNTQYEDKPIIPTPEEVKKALDWHRRH